jgi:hypothetical protein
MDEAIAAFAVLIACAACAGFYLWAIKADSARMPGAVPRPVKEHWYSPLKEFLWPFKKW